jgi:hypothetical protein
MTGKQFREAVGGLIKVDNEDGESYDAVKDMDMFR